MAAGYFAAGKRADIAIFDLFVRRLPAHRDYLVTAGLAQALEYLSQLRFTDDEIEWLRQLPVLAQAPPEFFTYLAAFRFTGTVRAMPEGTVAFAGEPLLTVRAPVIEAQLVETFLLSTIGFQTMIASKASRLVQLAQGRAIVEFVPEGGQSLLDPVIAFKCDADQVEDIYELQSIGSSSARTRSNFLALASHFRRNRRAA